MPIEYVPYMPDPIEGQALLNNFTRASRLLRYRSADDVLHSIDRGMPLYEVGQVETVGGSGSGNLVIRGECISACAYLKKLIFSGDMRPIDLVYIDPPFASEANYAKQIYLRRNPKLAARAREAGRQFDDEELRSFEETMYGDIWNKERYLNWMYENLRAIKSVMSEMASIYVHLDYHIVHYVKVLLDEIFGESQFVNEIIWQRTDPHNDAKNRLGRVHDTILWYSQSDVPLYNWESVMGELSDAALKEYSLVKLPDGSVVNYSESCHYPQGSRRFKLNDCTWKGASPHGKFVWRGARPSDKRIWPYDSPEEMDLAVARGEFYLRNPEQGAARCRVSYLDERGGQMLQDIWQDCGRMKGGTLYATQKPVALLERIVRASSHEGMLVADFFGGSGTTAVACARTGRNFIHVDVGVNSVQTVRQRLRETPVVSFDVLEIKDGVSLYRNPQQTMEKIYEFVPGLMKDAQLDDFWIGAFHTAREGLVPVYLPNLVDSATKLLDEACVLGILNEAIPVLPDGVEKVVIFYVDVVDIDELSDFIRENNDTLVDVELRDLKPLLSEAVYEDDFSYEIAEGGDTLLDAWRTTIVSFSSDRLERKIDEYNAKGALSGRGAFLPIALSEEGLEFVELVSLDCTADSGPWHADAEVFIGKDGLIVRDGAAQGVFWDGSLCSKERPLRIKVRNIAGDECVKVVE